MPLNYSPLKSGITQEIVGIIREDESWVMGSTRINKQAFAEKFQAKPLIIELVQRGKKNDSEFPIQRDSYMTNNHLEYALTWFALSFSTLLLLKGRRNKRMFKF